MTIKYFFAVAICITLTKICEAQVIDENAGKTYYYYDADSKKKVKEIFHHTQIVKIMPDPNNRGGYIDTFLYVRNGPYTCYDEEGKLICSGYYTQEKKDSIWKYYNPKGELIKTERYKLGALVK